MTDKYTDAQIEEHLKHAIKDSTPDILEQLMDEIEREPAGAAGAETVGAAGSIAETDYIDAAEPAGRRVKSRRRWYRTLAGCAAAALIFVGAFSVFHKGQDDVFATVSLDVNPSVELSVSKDQEIIGAKALNEDGTRILDDMDLEGSDVKVACNALIGSMVKNGYLSELSNSVLVSVQAEDEAKGQELEQMISLSLNDSLDSSAISGAVLGQYVADDEALEAFASENGISAGKAWVIRNLLETGSRHMTEESLLGLSTQELILLSQERNVEVDDFYGSADTSKYISKDDAKSIALNLSGRSDVPADMVEVEFDCDGGIITYEVEFTAGGQEYEYDINAETGEVVESDIEAEDGDDADDADDDADDVDDDDDRYDDDDYDDDHDDDDHDDDHDDEDDD